MDLIFFFLRWLANGPQSLFSVMQSIISRIYLSLVYLWILLYSTELFKKSISIPIQYLVYYTFIVYSDV